MRYFTIISVGIILGVLSGSYAAAMHTPAIDTRTTQAARAQETTLADTEPLQRKEKDMEGTQEAAATAPSAANEHGTQTLSSTAATSTTPIDPVPFYSQFSDISDPAWKKLGCGVASLAMLIELYEPGSVSVDALLQQGISAGAYLQNAGWTHRGLANLSKRYGLTGRPYDLSRYSMDNAFSKLSQALEEGPVIASVYYTFTPGHPIPHLVVINGIDGETVYYNDPAETTGGGTISVEAFKPAWKKRYIEVRPAA